MFLGVLLYQGPAEQLSACLPSACGTPGSLLLFRRESKTQAEVSSYHAARGGSADLLPRASVLTKAGLPGRDWDLAGSKTKGDGYCWNVSSEGFMQVISVAFCSPAESLTFSG